MLKVSVEILPGGDPTRRRTLGLLTIANATDAGGRSDYEVYATEGANPLASLPARACATIVRSHDRHQSVWRLIEAAAAAVNDDATDWVPW